MEFYCTTCRKSHAGDCRRYREDCDHYTEGHDVYRAARDSSYQMLQQPWWDLEGNSDKVSQFVKHPTTRIGTIQAPTARDAYRAAYCLAQDIIREYEPSILIDSSAESARPVILVAPSTRDHPRPESLLDSLAESLTKQLSPFVAPEDHRRLGCDVSDPSWLSDSTQDRLDVLTNLRGLVRPAPDMIKKRLCLVVDMDSADSEGTRKNATQVVRVLERLFVESGIADVLFFTSRAYELDRVLEKPDRAVQL
ncbi:hypothetical protein F5X96DRAFT_654780 [Biscogniauxia mediterranea]|nr:hypothetical protein F5X96DRAFT_654780 [Biscogniauxia mediterranea]